MIRKPQKYITEKEAADFLRNVATQVERDFRMVSIALRLSYATAQEVEEALDKLERRRIVK